MQNDLKEIITIIQSHKERAYRKINEELVSMYFEIGKYLSNKMKNEKWGSKAIEKVSLAITKEYPNIKGLNKTGLYRVIQFYETYRDNIIVSSLLRQINWTNNLIILHSTKTIEEKEFYIRLCIKNNYSKRELERQIKTGYFQRYPLLDLSKIDDAIEKPPLVFDYYSFDILDLPRIFDEKDLRKAIIKNLKGFILEIGKDFTFIQEEYRVPVGKKDYFIDLLFFNRAYSCLVAFELKIGEFESEYISKMNFYLEALDRQVKKRE